MRYTANYSLRKPDENDVVNIEDLNSNSDIIDHKLKELEDLANNAPENSVSDAAIGSRTPDQSQVPASPGTGTLTQLVSWLANRIKAITGKTNWYDPPPTTLQAAKNHIDATAPHSGHETPSGAQAKANAAEANAKGYTNTHAGAKNTHGVGSGYYIAKTSRSDQLPAWSDVQGKPSNFTPSAHKSTHAIGGSDALTPSDIGAETPAGAQAKVNAHAYLKNNPHNVTKSQVGLSNVDNIQQASKTEFNSLQTIVNNHIQSVTQVHGAASDAVPNSIMFRDANGRAKVTAPSQSDDIARKAEVDTVQTNLDAHINTSRLHSKTARFIIGTSTAGWTSRDCDYLCDGTNDQEEIIQALNALPATGGEVVILDGTYNITASINIPKDNVSIRGSGNATTLKRMYNSTNTDSGSTAKGLITLNEKNGCKIQGLQIDGNKATYTENFNYGIYLYSSDNNTITGNTCNNNYSRGISLSSSSNNTVTGNACNNNNNSGISLSSSSNNTVTCNACNNHNYGISLSSSSNNNTITGNTCNNNNSGISLFSSSSNNTVTGNTCDNNSSSGISLSSSDNNTITGNTCNNNSSSGIYLDSSSNNNTITGNTCNNNNYSGIYLSSSSNNTITGNTCNNNTRGIYLYPSSNNNTVTGNTCHNNSNYGIGLASSNNNTVTGNTCIRGTGQTSDYTTDQYTIRLSSAGNNYNLISSNNCMGKDVVIEGGTGNTSINNKYN